jgi:hypothetical protein
VKFPAAPVSAFVDWGTMMWVEWRELLAEMLAEMLDSPFHGGS